MLILSLINLLVWNYQKKYGMTPIAGICPNCKEQLKFNPFFLDENELRALTSDDRFLMEQLWMKTSLRDAFHRNSPRPEIESGILQLTNSKCE